MQFKTEIDGDLKLPLFVPGEDTGPLVAQLVASAPGKNLIAYREWMTLREFVAAFSRATDLQAEYVELPWGSSSQGLPGDLKIELDDNWACFNEFGYEGREDASVMHPRQVRRRNVERETCVDSCMSQLGHPPKLGSVADWIQKQDWSRLRSS